MKCRMCKKPPREKIINDVVIKEALNIEPLDDSCICAECWYRKNGWNYEKKN